MGVHDVLLTLRNASIYSSVYTLVLRQLCSVAFVSEMAEPLGLTRESCLVHGIEAITSLNGHFLVSLGKEVVLSISSQRAQISELRLVDGKLVAVVFARIEGVHRRSSSFGSMSNEVL